MPATACGKGIGRSSVSWPPNGIARCSLPVLQTGVSLPNVAGGEAEGRKVIEVEPSYNPANESVGC